jgi:hypothetical protein
MATRQFNTGTLSLMLDFMVFLLHLFHDQIIIYACDTFDAFYYFIRFIDGLWRINEAAELNRPVVMTESSTYLPALSCVRIDVQAAMTTITIRSNKN